MSIRSGCRRAILFASLVAMPLLTSWRVSQAMATAVQGGRYRAPRAPRATLSAWRDTLAAVTDSAAAWTDERRYRWARRAAPRMLRALDIPVGAAHREAEVELAFVLARRVVELAPPALLQLARRDASRATGDDATQRLHCYALGRVPFTERTIEESIRWNRELCKERGARVLQAWEVILEDVLPTIAANDPPRGDE